jgi:hypothetical protein
MRFIEEGFIFPSEKGSGNIPRLGTGQDHPSGLLVRIYERSGTDLTDKGLERVDLE